MLQNRNCIRVSAEKRRGLCANPGGCPGGTPLRFTRTQHPIEHFRDWITDVTDLFKNIQEHFGLSTMVFVVNRGSGIVLSWDRKFVGITNHGGLWCLGPCGLDNLLNAAMNAIKFHCFICKYFCIYMLTTSHVTWYRWS